MPLWWRLVRFGFRLLYNEMAFTYDLVSSVVSLGAWHCWQQTVLKHLPPSGARVLELAHGTGDLQCDLHQAGYRTIGYDLSPYMGRIARRKLRRWDIPAKLVRGKAQTLPFAAASFAAVVSTFPTDFIVAAETLHEVHRVLQADGRLVIVPAAAFEGASAATATLEWLYRVTGQRGASTEDAGIAPYFAQFGFEVELVLEPCPRSVAQVIIARKAFKKA
jgi:ubiquinone/menaquinone biosynthesis C-methylase UbiE